MSLIVEDGSGLSDAEAYASVAFADDYCEKRGIAVWATYTTTQKEVRLRNGAEYLDNEYRGRLIGVKRTDTQARLFPRFQLEDEDGRYVSHESVPTRVAQANVEAALRDDLHLAVDKPGSITAESKEIGPLKKSTTYGGSGRSQTPYYPKVRRLLGNFVTPMSVEVG